MLERSDWHAFFRRARFECADDPGRIGLSAGRPPIPGVLERDLLIALYIANLTDCGWPPDAAVRKAEMTFGLGRSQVYRSIRKGKPYLTALETLFG